MSAGAFRMPCRRARWSAVCLVKLRLYRGSGALRYPLLYNARMQFDEEQALVTFVVPCYNSAAYMSRGIDSLLAANHPVQIILVNDGSRDHTLDIANSYAARFSNIEVIDQQNANWGGCINRGLAAAQGRYFKVLDSDDWFDADVLQRVLDELSYLQEAGTAPDLFVTNYVYDRVTESHKHVIGYSRYMPEGRVFSWSELGHAGLDQRIMIHASWFKTAVLRESGMKLPEGVFYMDSHLVLHPLPYVKTLYYLNCNAYHYLIGREGQSVNVEVVKARIDQQLFATRLAIDDYDYGQLFERDPMMADCMARYVTAMMSVSTLHLFMIDTPEALAKNEELWGYLKQNNPTLYNKVSRTFAGCANRRTAFGRFWAKLIYSITRRIFNFA